MTTLDTLYRECSDLCRDRGVFAKSRRSLSHNDEGEWLTYVITLIRGLPSPAERQTAIDADRAPEPFR